MLEHLRIQNLGPATEMEMDLAPRLNLITGDNGLGKTLLLDSAWWALTHTWPLTWGGKGLVPRQEGATIAWTQSRTGGGARERLSAYDFTSALWGHDDVPVRPEPGLLADDNELTNEEERLRGPLVIYVRVDGGVSVHDPLRVGEDFRLPFGQDGWGRSNAFQFREPDIWEGLRREGETSLVCEGLVRDVGRWAVERDNASFRRLADLVAELAGQEEFRLTERVARVYVDDPRDHPILTGPAGELPAAHAPAGLRRVLGLAYLVVWAWREHSIAAGLKKRPPTSSLVLLIDEVESHLHPKWQRTILPSLLDALGQDAELQIVATTHSPMVLASVEATFDGGKDAWFDLDLDNSAQPPTVKLARRPYVPHGEIGNWLASEAFDLKEPRSLEGEQALQAAHAVWSTKSPSLAQVEAADEQLRRAGLPDIDPFWVRWSFFVEEARKRAGVKGS